MNLYFNTAGPCRPELHYMLPPTRRVRELLPLIEQQLYFVVHAPRQVGKTTSMIGLAKELTASGKYASVLVTCEQGAVFKDDVVLAEKAILERWYSQAHHILPLELCPPPVQERGAGTGIVQFLQSWSQTCPRPVVLFVDEIDSLENQALISVLRQLRAGFASRPAHFPVSIALIGMRDVRDYKVASGGSQRLHTASPFNVKAESLTLRNFTQEEIAELYLQHTAATGQTFTPEALELAWTLTRGQPWLVNALARQMVERLVPDRTQTITAAHVEQAKDLLIQRRDTHLDSLAERLREERVRRLIAPMISGEFPPDVPEDDWQYVLDLGLLRKDPQFGMVVANPLYQEVLPRVLTSTLEYSMGAVYPSWLTLEGKLDLDALLQAFLSFWRQHGEPLMNAAPYAEIAPHLVLMAFLHRVANGGGKVDREYAIGSGRLDLFLNHKGVKLAIECKVKRKEGHDPVKEGLVQLDRYLEGLGWPAGTAGNAQFQAWLFITDRTASAERTRARMLNRRRKTPQGREVLVIWG